MNKPTEVFFQERDVILIERLKNERIVCEQSAELADASGVDEESVLREMLDLGITAQTLPVFRLTPMIAVGWSNGEMCPKQCEKIFAAADRQGVVEGSEADQLLQLWTSKRIPGEITDAWITYSLELCKEHPELSARVVHDEVLSLAQEVAEAAGGIFGFGAVDASERAMLNRLESAFK